MVIAALLGGPAEGRVYLACSIPITSLAAMGAGGWASCLGTAGELVDDVRDTLEIADRLEAGREHVRERMEAPPVRIRGPANDW